MAKFGKRQMSDLQMTIEDTRINVAHAASIALAIWEEWESAKGITKDERESMIDCLTDAKIQIECALETLESK